MIWHLYDLTTGVFSGRTLSFGSLDPDDPMAAWFVEHNTPAGMGARNDVVDWEAQRVEVEDAGALIDYQPPAPSPEENYDWNTTTKRWQLNTTGTDAAIDASNKQEAQRQIDVIALSMQRQQWKCMCGTADAACIAEMQAAYDEMQSIAVAAGLWPAE